MQCTQKILQKKIYGDSKSAEKKIYNVNIRAIMPNKKNYTDRCQIYEI